MSTHRKEKAKQQPIRAEYLNYLRSDNYEFPRLPTLKELNLTEKKE